ncbi:hypothetical protein SAMN02910398_03749 [Butyrivibrio sp. YAB3001]|nr:hypothetical protein SAMN02910398_03749 [Butyrivibrio sp. YAB3001]
MVIIIEKLLIVYLDALKNKGFQIRNRFYRIKRCETYFCFISFSLFLIIEKRLVEPLADYLSVPKSVLFGTGKWVCGEYTDNRVRVHCFKPDSQICEIKLSNNQCLQKVIDIINDNVDNT